MNHHLTVALVTCACAISLAFAGEQPLTAPSTMSSPTTGPTDRIRVLIVDGFSNHDWRRTTACVRGILAATNLFDVTISTIPAHATDPAYAAWCPRFTDYDVVIQTCNDLNGNGPPWPPGARVPFENYVRDGGGVFMLHSANNAFADWDAYNHMLGIGWRKTDFGTALQVNVDGSLTRIPPGEGNGTSHAARTDRVVHMLGDHPIHAGLPPAWKTPLLEVYTYTRGPAENTTVISWAEDPKGHGRWPTEWVVSYGKGRAYSSSFGHVWHGEADPVDMRCAGFQTVLVRGLQWLSHRPVTFPVPTDFPTETQVSLRPPSW
jgi:hypothetical protein